MRSRRGALTGCALAAALLLAGCTAATSTVSVSGPLVIYLADPAGLAPDQQAQDVLDAEQLACSQLKASVTATAVNCTVLKAAKLSDNARTAIDDNKHAAAYVGEIVPGTSADSVGITDAQDLLQVSPTDNAAALNRHSDSVPGSPSHYYESFSTYGQTFARVVPSTQHEASALVAEMHALGVKTLAVKSDGGDYGRVLSAEVIGAESGQAISPASSSTGADAVLYAGNSVGPAASALNAAALGNPRVKLFVPSALADPAFTATLNPGAQSALYATSPGLTTSVPAATKFAADFRSSYGHAPAPVAIFGYAAVQAVIDALRRSGSKANDRSTVVGQVVGRTFNDTVLGSFSIDRYGDTNSTSFTIERVKGGRLVPVKTLQG